MTDIHGRFYYYVKDHLGSTRVLVRDDGVSSAKYYRYAALFGKYPGWSPYNYALNNPITRIDLLGLTDVYFTVQRISEDDEVTLGQFNLTNSSDDTNLGRYTLEPAWKENKEFQSRIPADTYSGGSSLVSSENFPIPHIRLESKNGRSDIIVHNGNTKDDTKGCILVGQQSGELNGKPAVLQSQSALLAIAKYISAIIKQDKAKGEQTTIIVIISDPPEKEEASEENK